MLGMAGERHSLSCLAFGAAVLTRPTAAVAVAPADPDRQVEHRDERDVLRVARQSGSLRCAFKASANPTLGRDSPIWLSPTKVSTADTAAFHLPATNNAAGIIQGKILRGRAMPKGTPAHTSLCCLRSHHPRPMRAARTNPVCR
jgi:hypothetical protein